MLIKNLSGLFSGTGFSKKRGRKPDSSDLGFVPGPVDIHLSDAEPTAAKPSCLVQKIGPSINPEPHEKVFDGSGCFATAGFVDSHTHALFGGHRSAEYFMRWQGKSYREISDSGGGIHNTMSAVRDQSDHELSEFFAAHLKEMIAGGSTTVEVKSGYGSTANEELRLLRVLKNFSNSTAARECPDLRRTFLGLHALPQGQNERSFVDSMMVALERVVAEKLADHVDAFPEQGFFSLEESLRFTRAATALGLKTKVHSDELSDMKASATYILEKALSIDHLQKINSEAVALLGKHETVATVLPATSFYLGLEYVNARALLDAGARVAIASDDNPGTAPNSQMLFSMLLAASQLKMSASEIFCAATYNGAAALGLEDDRGSLEIGKRADILLWSSRSRIGKRTEELIEEIVVGQHKPAFIFKNGERVF